MYQKRMKDPANRRLEIRLPEEDLEIWRKSAKSLNISLSEYVRRCVSKGKVNFVIKEEISLPEIGMILSEYGKIGSNINQIAHHLNEGMDWDDGLKNNLENQLADLERMHSVLMQTVRRFNGYI